MNRNLTYLLLVAFGTPMSVRPCDCVPLKPACAYLEADVIFLGRVGFTNDDGSGRFTQATLVRFDVEEHFKGVAADVRQIWVDPGSFTSCYEDYKLGERYLVFAHKTQFQNDSAAMTIMRDGGGKGKPLPSGFDLAKPPTLYYAPECAGSRPANGFPNFEQDLAMMRAYRGGAALPRVLGHIYLYPYRGWPVLSGPGLKGARVTLSSGTSTLRATTDEKGDFSLEDAPAGYYKAWAELPPFRMQGQVTLNVPEVGCGYTDVQLATTSTLQGVVLDRQGRPAPKIPVGVRLRDGELESATNQYALRTTTDGKGQFTITGLPDADVYLSAGNDYPTTDMPYRRVYFPEGRSLDTAAALRLKPGEQRQPMVLRLDAPIEKADATVHVVHKPGEPGVNASVRAFDDRGVILEFAKTDAQGVAIIPCLRGLKYELEAQTLRSLPWRGNILKSSRTPFTCGDPSAAFKLVLHHSAPY